MSSSSLHILLLRIAAFLTLAHASTSAPLSVSPRSLALLPSFDSEIELFGDANLPGDGSGVQLTRPSSSSSGVLVSARPFKLVDPRSAAPVSFSTEFTFSISPGNGDGIALFLFSEGFKFGSRMFGVSDPEEKRFVGVEFDTSVNEEVGDLNANHVGIDLGSFASVSVSNVSSMNDVVLSSGEKLRSWVDYEGSSKRLEVRLSKVDDPRPYDPIVAHSVDLLRMWRDEALFVGIGSSNGKSLQTSSVYSWSFRSRKVPVSMHSLPADPHAYSSEHLNAHEKSACPLRMVALVFLAANWALLLAFTALFLREVVGDKHAVFPVECPVHPGDLNGGKIIVVVEKDIGGGKN